jgi:protein involved in polysaccharide export with SLBB domain
MRLTVLRGLFLGLACLTLTAGACFADDTSADALKSPTEIVENYKLGAADQIRVLVYNEPNLSGEFVVNADGNLSLPLIGDVAAAGRTTGEIRKDIEDKLANGYLKSPQVSIDVLVFRPYFILGEVNKPGDYPYTPGLTVLKAVATANGFTYRADEKHVYLKHPGQASETKYPITSDLPLGPGDTIRIGERYF